MTNQAKPLPEGFHSVTPCLTFKNTLKAIEFYKKAFGAKVQDVLTSPDGGRTMHATIMIGDSPIMMGDEMPDCGKSAETMGGSPATFYIYVPNVDAAFKQAIAAGATETMPVDDMFWGDRSGSLKDPFGYSWMIGTHQRDLSQEEIEQGAQSFLAKMGKA